MQKWLVIGLMGVCLISSIFIFDYKYKINGNQNKISSWWNILEIFSMYSSLNGLDKSKEHDHNQIVLVKVTIMIGALNFQITCWKHTCNKCFLQLLTQSGIPRTYCSCCPASIDDKHCWCNNEQENSTRNPNYILPWISKIFTSPRLLINWFINSTRGISNKISHVIRLLLWRWIMLRWRMI